jgi:hypothetical protein
MLLLPLSFFAIEAQAQITATCTNASLNGSYHYLFTGTVVSGSSTVSYAELGTLTLDGNGNITSGSSTTSTAGVIAQTSFTGTYSVQSSCSGTGTWTANSVTTTFGFQVVRGGLVALSQVTVAGKVVDGHFYRVAPGVSCNTEAVAGPYGVLLSGWTYSGTTSTPYNAVGQDVFDGVSSFTTSFTLNVGTSGASALTGTGTYSLAANCAGTSTTNVGGITYHYNVARAEGGTVLVMQTDANTVITGTATLTNDVEVLPQFVYGGGWYTALYFTNTNSTPVSFTLNFTSDAGSPLTVPNVNPQVTLQPNATTILEALNEGSTVVQGYATVSLPAGVTGYGVFRQSVSNRPDQEAVVLFRSAASTYSTLTWDNTNFTTTFAIVNTSAVTVTVNVTAMNNAGSVIGTSSFQLAPYAKTENTLVSLTGLASVAGVRGSATFSVTNGSIAVMGLRFDAAAFTSVPAIQE